VDSAGVVLDHAGRGFERHARRLPGAYVETGDVVRTDLRSGRDKVVVCGAFVFFASRVFYLPEKGINLTGVEPWMVVLILVRELLVSAIRSYAEAQGEDFAANWVGKAKMFVQATSVCVILGVLAWYPETLAWLRKVAVWATVVVTALSIIGYIKRARAFILSASALGGSTSKNDTKGES